MKEYKCIKPFSVCLYDLDTDSYDETKSFDVEVGSIWQFENESGFCTGADIHLEGDDGWLEVNEEDLEEYFKEL